MHLLHLPARLAWFKHRIQFPRVSTNGNPCPPREWGRPSQRAPHPAPERSQLGDAHVMTHGVFFCIALKIGWSGCKPSQMSIPAVMERQLLTDPLAPGHMSGPPSFLACFQPQKSPLALSMGCPGTCCNKLAVGASDYNGLSHVAQACVQKAAIRRLHNSMWT